MLCCVVGRGAETQLASGWSKTVEQTFCRGCFHELERGTSARWKKKCQNRQDSLRLGNQMQPIGACERSHAAHEEKRGKNREKRKHGDIVCELDVTYWLHFNKGGVVILTLH